jgi:hypothetical protein
LRGHDLFASRLPRSIAFRGKLFEIMPRKRHGGSVVGDWLIQDFWFLGFRFQHWMPLAVLVFILMMIYAWWYERW